ncbi:unnamed protein product [Pylaiella littoralis]
MPPTAAPVGGVKKSRRTVATVNPPRRGGDLVTGLKGGAAGGGEPPKRRSREEARVNRYSGPLTVASTQSLVSTQNRFVKDELVTKLGIVDGAQLEERLPTDGDRRATVSQDADRRGQAKPAPAAAAAAAAGLGGVDTSVELTDFSDVLDEGWEAELAARRRAELVPARGEVATKGFLAGAECWRPSVLPVVPESREMESDAPPPPLVSDSESGSENDDNDNCVRRYDGGVKGRGEKLDGCLKKRGKDAKKGQGKKRVSFSSSAAGAAAFSAGAAAGAVSGSAKQNGAECDAAAPWPGAAAPASAVSVAADGAATATAAAAAAAGGAGVKRGGDTQNQGRKSGGKAEPGAFMEDYTAIERWVKDVAAGRVTAREAQLERFFRGRLDKPVISMVVESFSKDARGAVIACAGMLAPPITIDVMRKASRVASTQNPGAGAKPASGGSGTSVHWQRGGGGAAATGGGGGGGGSLRTGRHGDDDDDVDEGDVNAIVSRADYLLDTDCQDDGRLQALLDKAKGKEGIKIVRKKLAKAIKLLADELVANGCQDVKRLDILLRRAWGKIGLDKTRKMLKKTIKDITRRQDFDSFVFTAAGAAAEKGGPRAAKANVNNGKTKRKNIYGGDGDGGNGGNGADNDKKASTLLTISRTVARQLDRQRRGWPDGHVRQTLRFRPGLAPRVMGRNGVTLNNIVEKSQARVDVLKDTTNQKYYRVVTVRGVPTSVTHAVRLLCETIGDSVVVGEIEKHEGDVQRAGVAAKPRGSHDGPSGIKEGLGKAAEAVHATTNNNNINGIDTSGSNANNNEGNALMSNNPAAVMGGSMSVATVNVGAAGAAAAPVAASCGGHDSGFRVGSGFGGGTNDTFVDSGGDWLNSNSDVPSRSDLHNTLDVQGTEDMVERLTALARGGMVPRLPVRHQNPVVTAGAGAGAGAADSAAAAAACFSDDGRSPARQQHPAAGSPATSAAVSVSSVTASPDRQQYAPPATVGFACGGGGNVHGDDGGDVDCGPHAAAGTPSFDHLGCEGGGGYANVNAGGGGGRQNVPPGFLGSGMGVAFGENCYTTAPVPAPYNGAASTMGLPHSTAAGGVSRGGASPAAGAGAAAVAGYPAAAVYSDASRAFTPTYVASRAGVGDPAAALLAAAGFSYGNATAAAASATTVGYAETSTGAGAAADLTAAAYALAGRVYVPASPAAPAATDYPRATATGPSATPAVYPETSNDAASAAAAALARGSPCPAAQAVAAGSYGAPMLGTAAGQPAVAAAEQPIQSLYRTVPTGDAGGERGVIAGKGDSFFEKSGEWPTGADGLSDGGSDGEPATLPGGVSGIPSAGGVRGEDCGNFPQSMPAGAEGIGNGVGGGGGKGDNDDNVFNENDEISTGAEGWGGSDEGENNQGFYGEVGWVPSFGGVRDEGVTSGNGARGSATGSVRQPDPHVEAVLKAAKCERYLPLFIAKRVDLRELALMDEEDFKMLEDGEDPGANRLARGPQLKILHHCKRKLEELGIDINPEKDDQSSGDKTDKRLGSDGMCSVCRNDEIQTAAKHTSDELGGKVGLGLQLEFMGCCIIPMVGYCFNIKPVGNLKQPLAAMITFCPCGHQACCFKCGKNLEKMPCPICARLVDKAVRFYTG